MSLAALRNTLRLLACAGSLALLAGCASSHTAYLQDGRTAYLVQCNGVFGSWSGLRRAKLPSVAPPAATGCWPATTLTAPARRKPRPALPASPIRYAMLLVQCQGEQLAWRVGTFVRRLPVSEG